MKRQEKRIAGMLIGLSAILHFIYLGYPNQVVFDEVHFGKFVTAYCCTHQNFFDIHPPHAKLMIAGAAWLGGYRGGFTFERIGQPYGRVPVEWLRFVPAVAGSLLPGVIFILLRQLGAGRKLAGLGGLMVLLENSILVQTRMIALDGILLLSTFGSVSLYLAAWKWPGRRRYYGLAGAGALAGLAVGTKFTGLAALVLLGIMLGVRAVVAFRRRTDWIQLAQAGGTIAAAALVMYLAGWVLHFSLLDQPGSGDAFHQSDFSQNVVTDFFRETLALHKVMLSANYGLTATHAYASEWWQWPIMQRSVFYWQSDGRMIYFLGNPVVWWGSGLLLAAAAGLSIVWFGRGVPGRPEGQAVQSWIPLAGYVVSFVPLMRVPRALFLYHYLTPLLFGMITGLLWLEVLSRRYGRTQWFQSGWWVAAGLVVIGFIWWSPLTYGFLPGDGWASRLFLVEGWR